MKTRTLLKQLFAALLVGMLVTACAAPEKKAEKAPPSKEQVAAEQAIAAAKASLKKASSVGGEWRDSGKTVKKAEDAVAKGDYAAAMKLAKKAEKEGMMGQQQAEAEKNADIPQYVYDYVK
jgi:hypothetical protein